MSQFQILKLKKFSKSLGDILLNVDRPGEKLLIVTECDTKMQIASCAPIDAPQLLFQEVFLREREVATNFLPNLSEEQMMLCEKQL